VVLSDRSLVSSLSNQHSFAPRNAGQSRQALPSAGDTECLHDVNRFSLAPAFFQ
jgi:hypothetical protein